MNSGLGSAQRQLALAGRPPRWREYRRYICLARSAGYRPVSLEPWLLGSESLPPDRQLLLLRHDVDQDSRSALLMSDAERKLGVRSTFYFRWRTFERGAVSRIAEAGNQVGLHYETLTRHAIERGYDRPEQITTNVVDHCRRVLREEIACFKSLVGSCATVAAHGDFRASLIGRPNVVLLDGENYSDYGVVMSADDAGARRAMDCWVSDGSGVPTYWSAGTPLADAVLAGHDTILFNSHPHHWRSGSVLLGKELWARLEGRARVRRHYDEDSLAWREWRARA